ncbi:HAD-IA family hydrolase [Aliidiomarina halalkaliphila]|uniref:HAD-IA family hydrolase n=1 Tax=Aliidiomarina halalkaliphila TaxID=2593535 RepID=A0A552WZV1_9GAMM|nr:HAD-IA family hydrolase [Aliidiomarina halalkaliphila]TRW48274.1 HAD-IA family hydrolase [Aliidiomarina halalkaliphila]
MWHFHQRLQPFTAISFDLDDTLYDNAPVIQRAEQLLADHIATAWPSVSDLDAHAWRKLRDAVAAEDAELASDMTALRLATLTRGLTERGISLHKAKALASEGMEVFLHARNDVLIAPEVHTLLAELATRYPLVAVSNGNADIYRLGLGDYFERAFHPGEGRRGKPYSDLFVAAGAHLQLAQPMHLLHVGDHPVSDVQGALRYGAQAIWFAPKAPPVEMTRLPHATIEDLHALRHLLT